MKKIFTILFLYLLSSNLIAQHRESENILDKLLWDDNMLNIMVDTRMDVQAEITDNESNSAGFRAQTFRLWLAGEIIPGVRYRIRHRFNKPQTPLIRDNYSVATDQAWVALDAGKDWTFTIGKQSVQLGTFEYDYNGADIYLSTMVNGDFDLYKMGVNVAYKFAGQMMNLQVVNSDAPQFASEAYKDKAFAINLLWQGNLLNETLKTRWGYGLFQHSKKKFYNWFTLGTQLNIKNFTTELDCFLGSRNMDYGSIVGDSELGDRYVRDKSLSLNLKYNLDKWHPSIKGTWNQRFDKNMDRNAYENMGIQAALEFYPFTNSYTKDMRFHIAYVYNNTDFQGQFSSLNNEGSHLITGGMRWLFKVK